ncbi:hypothetical protein JOF56_006369 [Kibdelosporangium banguiense]|uniref:PASTA domain-containing protein n=1 Tax=Kibdelosporangium banguiense TaxID=1365924 RepID=A0ABS4TNJ7_9PSEU|nr:hypothetical protein [Kibdelosporangium banguiense]MBP2325984.1 hypothetical protein [Kibdelosporangium banguiense]
MRLAGILLRNPIKGSIVVVFAAMAAAGCGRSAVPASTTVPASGSAAETVESTSVRQVTPDPEPVAPTAESSRLWAMPNLVGSNLQKAQDQIQKLTGNPVFITRSHDATGKKRNQVVDSHWKVCSQNIAPGSQISTQSNIDFGAVKNEETCP